MTEVKTEFKKRMYLGDFTSWGVGGTSYDDTVLGQFQAGSIKEPTYVFAHYARDSYDGSALVLYKQGRKWYQVYGSHCSCHGLENQFEPQEFDPELHFKAVKEGKRIITGYSFDDNQIDGWLKWATTK